MNFRAGNRLSVCSNLGNNNLFNSVFALNINNCVRKIKRNIKIVEALNNISLQAAGIRHKLNARKHLCAFKCHTPCHNKADVAGAENNNSFTNHMAFDINISLSRTCGKNTCRASAGNGDCAPCALTAAHCKNNGFCRKHKIAFLRINAMNFLALRDFKHHSIGHNLNCGVAEHFNEFACIFGACELLFKIVQAKAVVNALIKYAAEFFVSFNDKYIFKPVFISGKRCGKACRTAADNYKIIHYFAPPHFVSPVRI